jgi:small subunit ribosomal protein S20
MGARARQTETPLPRSRAVSALRFPGSAAAGLSPRRSWAILLRRGWMRAAARAALPRTCGMRPPTSQIKYPKRGFRVANIKSQIKRNKQNEKARQRNKAVKSTLKTSVRKFREAADAGDADAVAAAMRAATRDLDKAASKGVIHKNQAANRKSAIAKRAAELQS